MATAPELVIPEKLKIVDGDDEATRARKKKAMKATVEEASRKLAVKEQKEKMLAHQIQCLQEDNDRLAKMYT